VPSTAWQVETDERVACGIPRYHIAEHTFREPSSVPDLDWDVYRYESELNKAVPVKVRAASRYQRDDDAITIINSEWELRVNCYRAKRDEVETGPYVAVIGATLEGTIQLYLPDGEALPQIISTNLRPKDPPRFVHFDRDDQAADLEQ
jgi:hypothetical protein